MRLDVFLKTSRLIKRRPLAKEFCDQGRVLTGGTPAKASREVRPGDLVTLMLPKRKLVVEVLDTPAGNVPKAAAAALYRVVEESAVMEDEF